MGKSVGLRVGGRMDGMAEGTSSAAEPISLSEIVIVVGLEVGAVVAGQGSA